MTKTLNNDEATMTALRPDALAARCGGTKPLALRAKVARAAATLAPSALTDAEAFVRSRGWLPNAHYRGAWDRPDAQLGDWTLTEAVAIELVNLAVRELERAGWTVTAGGATSTGLWLNVLQMRDPIARRYVGSWTAAYARHVARTAATAELGVR